MDTRRPTIADVAKRAGVSKGLVSFVFNDKPGVAAPTRVRILAAAEELGWQPDPVARSLSTQRAAALGLVVRRDPTVLAADPFFPAFMAGVETALTERRQVLVLSLVPDAAAETATYRSLAAHRRVDGVLLTDLRHDDDRFPLLAELGLPAVCVGRPDVAGAFPVVNLDDAAGLRSAVDHLVGLGHRRIAYVGGDVGMLHGRRRRKSFLEALARHGLDPVGVVDTDFSAAAGARAVVELLAGAVLPTALVFASDPMAVAGLAVLQRQGVQVPRDCSVTGFDGMDLGRHLHPALTTVEADPLAWGRAAATVLLRLLDDGRADDLELPSAALVLRSSTAPPPDPPG
ncbi:DNA-binding transcriptional regulator, LacI/PurR family [Friedmanniella luteola]|uniref:DNA-binding transcriptional regulator, LacI/PurR family n=1 Tax=Friedmanniella luteola TaxID=546871 RepID=A0A1H1R6R4_9ACTN|nr:LacI family DNA-binding transcriptional regulator [Friedmanniella luteola]SDS31504.1 DNA-binding transcriptional regulator, LacI/PurR family [Friedmanniella luteola]